MNLDLMKTLTTLNQKQMRKVLLKFLKDKGYKNIKKNKHFILAEGEVPVCLIAHIDTVFKWVQVQDNFIYDQEQHILYGIGGSGFDDRAGIYAIITLLQRGHRPHILFTDLEEVGGVGAHELIERYTKWPFKTPCNALIELDRANEKDAVYYSCNNEEFEIYIESFGFEYEFGTFTDISVIMPIWKIAGVNLSVGYCNEHTESEILHTDWLDATIDKVEELLLNSKSMKKYKYIPSQTIYKRPYKISANTCLICGAPLDEHNRRDIYDEEFPYSVCESCYNQYYITDETYNTEVAIPF